MDEYLSTTVSKLKSNDYNELNLVLGNESCDLDSAVSAVVYATFLHWQYSQIKCKACTGKYRDDSYRDDIFVPVLDVQRNDYPLKTEVLYCLKEHGIGDNDLVFRDDINIQQLLSKGKINVILVDHHILSQKHEFLSPYVIEIIDHRPALDMSFKDVRSTIQTVGSCCTLVSQRIKDLAHLMSKDGVFFKQYPVAADLLHDVIILDTVNFSKEVNKGTQLDEESVIYLECFINPDDCQQERSSKLRRLVEARARVSLLDAAQLLRKDLKLLGDLLVPSLPILVKEFLGKPDALRAVLRALESSRCSVALLLGMKLTSGLQRDGAVVCSDQVKGQQLVNFLKEWSKPSLKLLIQQEDGYVYFKQMNASASRKQYMLALDEFNQSGK